jgi:hypothetical protein
MTSKEILTEFANKSIEIIRKNMDEMNINATGQSSKSLRSEYIFDASIEGIEIWGKSSLAAVEFGRKPTSTGAAAGSPTLIEAIKDWIAAKGLSLNPYAVANKIHRMGTLQYRKGGKRGLLEGVLDQNRVAQLLKDLGTNEIMNIKGTLIKDI